MTLIRRTYLFTGLILTSLTTIISESVSQNCHHNEVAVKGNYGRVETKRLFFVVVVVFLKSGSLDSVLTTETKAIKRKVSFNANIVGHTFVNLH